ncbi:universal stress protein [Chloroflexota bacterium]
MFNRILVPLDGSKLAESALPYAEELAGAFNSEIALLFVCDTPRCKYRYEHQVYVDKMAELTRNNLEGERPKTSVKPVVVEGHPATEISDYADQNDISLIVMATHGRTGIMSWAMGSIANKVLDRVRIPILLIRGVSGAEEAGQMMCFGRIMLPLDGSEAGEAALPYVIEIANKLYPEIILLQVVAPGQHVHTVGGLDYVRFTEQQVASMTADAKDCLGQVGNKLTRIKATVRPELKFGDPAEEIIKLAGEMGACMVAMSTHGHSGIDRWTFGSVTHKVLHSGNTPLLLVRAPGAKR